MYSDRIFLTPQEILDKEFKIDARGYRPQEVDKYLDMVIRDYTEFVAIIKKLEKDINNLTEDNSKLRNELRRIRSNIEAAESTSNNGTNVGVVSNVDLLRRLSQLEKVVFGKE
ncbi:MAG TPA: cell division regulator GpsB [Bacilli bacterium]|nr:cell division regulator GpsB [Bacilli bacterium]